MKNIASAAPFHHSLQKTRFSHKKTVFKSRPAEAESSGGTFMVICGAEVRYLSHPIKIQIEKLIDQMRRQGRVKQAGRRLAA
jgi:hypothetical protein